MDIFWLLYNIIFSFNINIFEKYNCFACSCSLQKLLILVRNVEFANEWSWKRDQGIWNISYFSNGMKIIICFYHKISDFFDTCNSHERIFLLHNQALFKVWIWKLQISDADFRHFRNLLRLHRDPGSACELLKINIYIYIYILSYRIMIIQMFGLKYKKGEIL